MTFNCIWEHNGSDTLLYSADCIGAYTRGESLETALKKMPAEIASYLEWCGGKAPDTMDIAVAEEKVSELNIRDADSDVLFGSEIPPLTVDEYRNLKALALKSAEDFQTMYEAVPDKNAFSVPERRTFYGLVPRSANDMYIHTRNVNEYYFAEIKVKADNLGSICECRKRGFEKLEQLSDYLLNAAAEGSYGESWTLRCARCSDASSGTTAFTPRQCTEWLLRYSERKAYRTRFASGRA